MTALKGKIVQLNWKRVADYIRENIIPDFEGFSQVVIDRILPTFDTFGTDALEFGEDWFQKKASGLNPLDDDQYELASHYADKAMDKTLGFADTLVSMYFASVGLFSVGLYHLFEQHFTDLPLRFLKGVTFKDEFNRQKAVKALLEDSLSIRLDKFASWPIIDGELRRVVGTIKHAEGHSAKKLRSSHPKLFIHPAEREGNGWSPHTKSRIRKPLFGDDIYITINDFSRYAEAIKTFWIDLADEMSKH